MKDLPEWLGLWGFFGSLIGVMMIIVAALDGSSSKPSLKDPTAAPYGWSVFAFLCGPVMWTILVSVGAFLLLLKILGITKDEK